MRGDIAETVMTSPSSAHLASAHLASAQLASAYLAALLLRLRRLPHGTPRLASDWLAPAGPARREIGNRRNGVAPARCRPHRPDCSQPMPGPGSRRDVDAAGETKMDRSRDAVPPPWRLTGFAHGRGRGLALAAHDRKGI
jgi:hypothetical protein